MTKAKLNEAATRIVYYLENRGWKKIETDGERIRATRRKITLYMDLNAKEMGIRIWNDGRLNIHMVGIKRTVFLNNMYEWICAIETMATAKGLVA